MVMGTFIKFEWTNEKIKAEYLFSRTCEVYVQCSSKQNNKDWMCIFSDVSFDDDNHDSGIIILCTLAYSATAMIL